MANVELRTFYKFARYEFGRQIRTRSDGALPVTLHKI